MIAYFIVFALCGVVSERRITAVDRVNKKIMIDGAAITASAGFIANQRSYNKELTGFDAIFDDSINTIYEVSKTENPIMKPITVDRSGGINDITINDALRRAQREKNSSIDMLLCGDVAQDSYTAYLRENNVRVENNFTTVENFKAIRFIFGNREVVIANEPFIPKDEIWGFDTKTLEFHSLEWDFAQLQGGGVFNLIPGQSVYHALLANYGNLVCSNPGGCIRIHNIPDPTV